MTKKNRVPIPENIAAQIQYASDRTCCVCTENGRAIQIHHIDEDPSNNSVENLAVLCLECHNKTETHGGFGRKLDAAQIKMYNKEWLNRVKNRRDKADELASIRAVAGPTESMMSVENTNQNLSYITYDDPKLLKDYIEKIIIVQQKAKLEFNQTKWDTGTTAKMNEGVYDMIDFYERVLIELSAFYPLGHFNNQNPEDYFSEIISSKWFWYRLMWEPCSIGTSGSMTTCLVGGDVMSDVKKMVVDMVYSLLNLYVTEIDFEKWHDEWCV